MQALKINCVYMAKFSEPGLSASSGLSDALKVRRNSWITWLPFELVTRSKMHWDISEATAKISFWRATGCLPRTSTSV